MRKPLNKIELYAALLPLLPKMQTFKETDSASLTAEDVQLLQEVYPDVQVLTSGGLPMRVNVGCASCIRDIFHVFTSLFDRLAADPHVNPASKVEAMIAGQAELDEGTAYTTANFGIEVVASLPPVEVPLYNEGDKNSEPETHKKKRASKKA